MRGKIWAAVAAAVLVAAAVAAYGVMSGQTSTHRVAATPNAGRKFAPRAATISREVRSGNAADLQDAIAMPGGVKLDPAAARSLAALKGLTFEMATFHEKSPSTAVVRAVVTDSTGVRRTWTVTLVSTGGEWKLALSTPASS